MNRKIKRQNSILIIHETEFGLITGSGICKSVNVAITPFNKPVERI